MIIQCPSCETKFRMDDDFPVDEKGQKIECSNCKNTFVIKKKSEDSASDVARSIRQNLDEFSSDDDEIEDLWKDDLMNQVPEESTEEDNDETAFEGEEGNEVLDEPDDLFHMAPELMNDESGEIEEATASPIAEVPDASNDASLDNDLPEEMETSEEDRKEAPEPEEAGLQDDLDELFGIDDDLTDSENPPETASLPEPEENPDADILEDVFGEEDVMTEGVEEFPNMDENVDELSGISEDEAGESEAIPENLPAEAKDSDEFLDDSLFGEADENKELPEETAPPLEEDFDLFDDTPAEEDVADTKATVNQDELDALFDGVSEMANSEDAEAATEEAVNPDETVSQDELDALFDEVDETTEEATEPDESLADAGETVNQGELDALFDEVNEETEEAPGPKETLAGAGETVNQDELDALFDGGDETLEEIPGPEEALADAGETVNQDELDALFDGGDETLEDTPGPEEALADAGETVNQDELDALFDGGDDTLVETPGPEEALAASGETVNQDELDAMFDETETVSGDDTIPSDEEDEGNLDDLWGDAFAEQGLPPEGLPAGEKMPPTPPPAAEEEEEESLDDLWGDAFAEQGLPPEGLPPGEKMPPTPPPAAEEEEENLDDLWGDAFAEQGLPPEGLPPGEKLPPTPPPAAAEEEESLDDLWGDAFAEQGLPPEGLPPGERMPTPSPAKAEDSSDDVEKPAETAEEEGEFMDLDPDLVPDEEELIRLATEDATELSDEPGGQSDDVSGERKKFDIKALLDINAIKERALPLLLSLPPLAMKLLFIETATGKKINIKTAAPAGVILLALVGSVTYFGFFSGSDEVVEEEVMSEEEVAEEKTPQQENMDILDDTQDEDLFANAPDEQDADLFFEESTPRQEDRSIKRKIVVKNDYFIRIGVIEPIAFTSHETRVLSMKMVIEIRNEEVVKKIEGDFVKLEENIRLGISDFFQAGFYDDILYVQDKLREHIVGYLDKYYGKGSITDINYEEFKLE